MLGKVGIRVIAEQSPVDPPILQIFEDGARVRFIFAGNVYREPAADELHVLRGVQGSYPNFFFDVPEQRLAEFVDAVGKLKPKDASARHLLDAFGVRRMDPHFWEVYDWFNDRFREEQPLEFGWLDLSRYQND